MPRLGPRTGDTDDKFHVLLSCPGVHHLRTDVWPGSCTVESLLISSCQIFQAAFIFKKWASQQTCAAWHGLLRSRIHHRLCLLYQERSIYSRWFCCGPYQCGVRWGTSIHDNNDRKCRMALYLQHVPWLTLMSWVKLKALICRRPDMYSCI